MKKFQRIQASSLAVLIPGVLVAMAVSVSVSAWAQTSQTVTPTQRATASEVAEKGVPLSELAPDAPDSYTIKAGDTLWGISTVFLKSPWRWPELWGMNMKDIQNPHRIYPGQKLVLEKSNGRAVLKVKSEEAAMQSVQDSIPTVKVTPQTRYSALAETAIPTLPANLLAPFLVEPMVVDKDEFDRAPRIIATQEERVLLSRGDRAYARSVYDREDGPFKLLIVAGKSRDWRVFRSAAPLKDPTTQEVIGYEAQYLGQAQLVRSEGVQTSTYPDGKTVIEPVPATVDIVTAKEEIRTGDRLVPEPERGFQSYVPHLPVQRVEGQIVSVYGSAVSNASTNQVVVLNRGSKQGLENGHVLTILKKQDTVTDKTDPRTPQIALPTERNGLVMVFRTFDQLSYALILGIIDAVKVGDHVGNPR